MTCSRWPIRTLWLGAVIPCLFIACAGSGDEQDDDQTRDEQSERWFCQDNGSYCSCRALPPGRMAAGSDEVDQCGVYNCCVFSGEATEDAEATCSCFSTDATCEQEAATRPGSEVVSECPPGSQQPEVACASEGENCRSDYLRQNDLEGCCEGTLCRQDENGVPVCQAASTEDLALHARCEDLAASSEFSDFTIQPMTLSTSHGFLTISEVGLSSALTGPGGCLNEFDIRLGDLSCGLNFSGAIVDGALKVTDVSGFLDACPGFSGSATDGYVNSVPAVVTDFSFEGLACDAGRTFESYCIAGAFIFTLGGTAGDLTFNPQTLTIEGAACTPLEATGECPTGG